MLMLFDACACFVRDVSCDVVWFVVLYVVSVFVVVWCSLCLCVLLLIYDVMLCGLFLCFCGCACDVLVG